MPSYNIHITGAVFKTGFRYFLKVKVDVGGLKREEDELPKRGFGGDNIVRYVGKSED